jgi:acyl-CoA thioesterase-1
MNKLIIIVSIFILASALQSCKDGGKGSTNTSDAPNKKDSATVNTVDKTILFFGNSLTAGYGLEPTESFPSLIQQKIDSANLNYKVVNAGVSGETSSAGNSRIDWILKQPIDVFVLELGANDGLRGLPVAETRKNLQSIIDKVKKKYPEAKLVMAGMQVPPNMGEAYANDFRKMFGDLAKENDMALITFLLEGVGGIRELNLPDGIHPTSEGQKIVANNVWKVLEPLLKE